MSEGKKEYRMPKMIPWFEIPSDADGIRIIVSGVPDPNAMATLTYYPRQETESQLLTNPKPDTE